MNSGEAVFDGPWQELHNQTWPLASISWLRVARADVHFGGTIQAKRLIQATPRVIKRKLPPSAVESSTFGRLLKNDAFRQSFAAEGFAREIVHRRTFSTTCSGLVNPWGKPMHENVLKLIKDVPFFIGIPPEKLADLVGRAQIKSYTKNSIIVNEGDQTTNFYLLISGKVRVFVGDNSGEGRELTLSYHGPGTYFGELALLDDNPRSATIMATEKTTCAVINRADFIAWLSMNHPDVALAVIRDLIKRIRFLTRHAGRLALADVYSRLTDVLNEMAEEDESGKVISNKPTRQELANMIGASREMVTRIIRDLINGHYITEEGEDIRIIAPFPKSY